VGKGDRAQHLAALIPNFDPESLIQKFDPEVDAVVDHSSRTAVRRQFDTE
jgi:hypothetical protein